MKPILVLLSLSALAAAPVTAQAPGQPTPDPFARYLYSPDLVLDNQLALKLSEQAKSQIKDAMLEAQKRFLGLQFLMSQETETLKNLLRIGKVDEAAVLKQIDQMLGIEREMKRAQLSLMIKVKNTLTPEQQTLLDKIRERGGSGSLE